MIGILGGTFDPVHHGHLRLAIEVYERLGLREVRFIPAARPAHRYQPLASPLQRLTMLKLALEGERALRVDEREMERPGPSYMVDTLYSLRQEVGNTPLVLIIGTDAFNGIMHWHNWEQLIDLTHFLIVQRPGCPSSDEADVKEFLQRHAVEDSASLHQQPAGHIFILEHPSITLSATYVRHTLKAGRNPRYLLPVSVLQFIQREGLYRS